MLRSRAKSSSKPVETGRGSEASHVIKRSRRRKRPKAEISPHTIVVGCLIIATIVEVFYLALLGAFQDKDLWKGLFGSIWNSWEAPIDNYYSRPHIRTPVPLIVGGSDGSGTRAWTHVLELLDVAMIVDDRGTMDVHAKEMFDGAGWPALVSRVLNVAHSADYDVDILPESLVSLASRELQNLLSSMERRGVARQKSAEKVMASAVTWGFKAPISQLLLPFFRKQLPAFKMLHIVRDGRDVALSDNTSPVEKFYSAFYRDAIGRDSALLKEGFGELSRSQIKAIQLWNDWNRQVYDYGVSYSDGKTMDVLVVRTEDLLDNAFETLLKLADFVGSPKTSYDLCCMSRKGLMDMGKSGGGKSVGGRFVRGGVISKGKFERGGTMAYDNSQFDRIRERFEEFVPKEARAAWEHKHPEKSFEEIKQELFGKNNAHAGGEGQEMMHGNDLDGKAAEIRRRLLVEQPENDDAVDVFKSGGRKVSNVIHALNINDMVAGDNRRNAEGSESYSLVNRIQQQIDERQGWGPKKKEDARVVKGRYGKWVRILQKDPTLSQRLHEEGKKALQIFGYEPKRPFMESPRSQFTCDATVLCEES